jgi:hypothetical protein
LPQKNPPFRGPQKTKKAFSRGKSEAIVGKTRAKKKFANFFLLSIKGFIFDDADIEDSTWDLVLANCNASLPLATCLLC